MPLELKSSPGTSLTHPGCIAHLTMSLVYRFTLQLHDLARPCGHMVLWSRTRSACQKSGVRAPAHPCVRSDWQCDCVCWLAISSTIINSTVTAWCGCLCVLVLFASACCCRVNLSGPDRCRPGVGPAPALIAQGFHMQIEHRRRVLVAGDSAARAMAFCVLHQDGDIHLRWGSKPPYCLRRGLGAGACQSLSSTAAHVDGSPQTSK